MRVFPLRVVSLMGPLLSGGLDDLSQAEFWCSWCVRVVSGQNGGRKNCD